MDVGNVALEMLSLSFGIYEILHLVYRGVFCGYGWGFARFFGAFSKHIANVFAIDKHFKRAVAFVNLQAFGIAFRHVFFEDGVVHFAVHAYSAAHSGEP